MCSTLLRSAIPVQPTSVARRRQGLGRGSASVRQGRPIGLKRTVEHGFSKSHHPAPKRRPAPHNLTHCVEQNINIGGKHWTLRLCYLCYLHICTMRPNCLLLITSYWVLLLCYHFVCIMCYFRISKFHLNFTIINFILFKIWQFSISVLINSSHTHVCNVRLLFLYQSIPFLMWSNLSYIKNKFIIILMY